MLEEAQKNLEVGQGRHHAGGKITPLAGGNATAGNQFLLNQSQSPTHLSSQMGELLA